MLSIEGPTSCTSIRFRTATSMSWILAIGVSLSACDDARDPPQETDWDAVRDCTASAGTHVPGGGWRAVALPPHNWVCVADAETGKPITDAEVEMADGRAGLTGTNGLVVFEHTLGKQIVTVRAPGMATTTVRTSDTWAITVPLEPERVRTAIVEGTIQGWNSLPEPAAGHHRIARIQTTETWDPTARANHLAQMANECRWEPETPCTWRLTTRIGVQQQLATIIDVDDQGTPDDSADDTFLVTGYALGDLVTLADGESRAGVVLGRVLDAKIALLVVEFPPLAEDLERVAVPSLDLGASGRAVVAFPPVTPAHTAIRMVDLDGAHDVTEWSRAGGATPAYVTRTMHGLTLPAVVTADDEGTARPALAACGEGCWQINGDRSTARVVQLSRGDRLLWKQIGMALDGAITPPIDAVSPEGGPLQIRVDGFLLDEYVGFDLSFQHLFATQVSGSGFTATVEY
jgi:hypothetical protein